MINICFCIRENFKILKKCLTYLKNIWMTKHIFKITETEDIRPRITTWNWKGRPENKKKPGVGVNRFFFYKQKSYHSVLTSQFLNIYMYIYKKKSFKNNIIMNIEYAQILRCQMGVVQDAPHSPPPPPVIRSIP